MRMLEPKWLRAECRWKVATLRRSRRFFSDWQMVQHFKSHVLSFIEYRTSAIYHAAECHLEPLDALQRSFLKMANMTPVEALMVCNMAPLHTRRDMSMLGLAHRSVLGLGPKHLQPFSKRVEREAPQRHTRLNAARHKLQLEEFEGRQDYVKHSAPWA